MAPAGNIPPSLPPSVEEAYRRKCVQLKNRTTEIEESNDAARLRLSRIKRQVEKLRIERAFLLEQLARRTSANVEDSDGSPSPPPTEQQYPLNADTNRSLHMNQADANLRKPKEKPLRIKRGHRKADATGPDGEADPDADPDADPEAKEGANSPTATRRSPAASERRASADDHDDAADDDAAKNEKKEKKAFEAWAKSRRAELEEARADKEGEEAEADAETIDAELEAEWKKLPQEDKDRLIAEQKASKPSKKSKATRESRESSKKKDDADAPKEAQDEEKTAKDEKKDEKPEVKDEDVVMADTDADQTEEKKGD